jgi:peptide/nickel transport system substrate-binding protein
MTVSIDELTRSFIEGKLTRRQMLMRLLALGLSLPVASAIIAACSNTANAPKGSTAVFRLGWSDLGNQSLSPASTSTNTQVIYLDPLYDYLTYLKLGSTSFEIDQGKGLATKIVQSSDGKSWTFSLREGVKFHNGDPLTADDVKFTFELYMSPMSTHGAKPDFIATIASIVVDDPYTVTFHTKQIANDFAIKVSDSIVEPILPMKYIQQVGYDVFTQHPIGSGPYKFVKQDLGSLIVMEAVPDHWRGKPTYKSLEFHLIPETTTRLAALKAGEVDAIDVPLAQLNQVPNTFRVIETKNATVAWINFGGLLPASNPNYNAKVPWTNKDVRVAMSLAIDRNALVSTVYAGKGQPAGIAPWMPGDLGYPVGGNKPASFDLAQARQLLKNAGYGNGFPVNMQAFVLVPEVQLPGVAEAVALMWQQIGLKVTIQPTTFAAIRPAYSARKLSDSVWPMRMIPRFDLTGDLTTFFYSTGAYPVANSPQIDKLVLAAQNEPDLQKRVALIGQMIDYVNSEQLLIPLVYGSSIVAMNSSVAPYPTYLGQGYRLPYASLHPSS